MTGLVAAGVVAAFAVVSAIPSGAPVHWPHHVSAYEWRALSASSLASLTARLPAFAAYGGTSVALDISQVVDIAEMPDAKARSVAQANFDAALSSYVDTSARSGLSVEALAGSPTWISPEHRYLNGIVSDFVYRYNRGVAAGRRLQAIQFDLEPWGTSAWSKSSTTLTTQLLDTVSYLVGLKHDQPSTERVPLVFALPFWLDGSAAPTTVNYTHIRMSPTEHVIRILDDGPGTSNSVTIMAYRDTPFGSNGTLALTSRELTLSAARGGRVKVRVGQEISDVDPRSITFHQEGAQALSSAIATIAEAHQSKPAFGGVAINDLASLEAGL